MSLDVSDWRCAVCLEEPMCKPAVPRCGHAGCFWCVHRAMDHFGVSACPTCRQPFEHLPDVCVPLHRFLARAFPAEYARRLRETHEEEETKECFSPEPALDLDLGALRLTEKKEDDEDDGDDAAKASPLAFFDALERAPAMRGADDPALERVLLCGFRDDRELRGPDSKRQTRERGHVLRHPVVLTCGHAVCASCAAVRLDFRDDRDDDASEASSADPLRRAGAQCPVCDARVVGNAPPSVCLLLHDLTCAFAAGDRGDRLPRGGDEEAAAAGLADPPRARPADAAARRSDRPTEGPRGANGTLAERFLRVTGDVRPETFVHHAVGCDGCGAYPIRGRRFTCADCASTAMGFDLCARCHASLHAGAETKPVRGRFNQNHTGAHVMHEVAPVPTVMHFLTAMHPDLTPAQILDLAARRAEPEPERGEAREGEEDPSEARGEET